MFQKNAPRHSGWCGTRSGGIQLATGGKSTAFRPMFQKKELQAELPQQDAGSSPEGKSTPIQPVFQKKCHRHSHEHLQDFFGTHI